MSILDIAKERTVQLDQRSLAAGYAGFYNHLFYIDKIMMIFGDLKKVVEDFIKSPWQPLAVATG